MRVSGGCLSISCRGRLGDRLVKYLWKGKGRPIGHDNFRLLGKDDIFLRKMQPFGKNPHQGAVEGQGAALKGHGLFYLQALGQAADGLLGDGVKGGEGQIGPGNPLVYQRLDVCLCIDPAAAGYVKDALSLPGQAVEFLHRHLQYGCRLINKGTCAPCTCAVHTHV